MAYDLTLHPDSVSPLSPHEQLAVFVEVEQLQGAIRLLLESTQLHRAASARHELRRDARGMLNQVVNKLPR